MSDDLAHVLADILGIEPLQFNVRKSPLRDEFDASRRRMTNGNGVDYDENLKGRGGYGR